MRMTTEEVDHPVIHFIRQSSWAILSSKSDSVKRLAEIQRHNDNIWIVYEHMSNDVQKRYHCCCWWSSWPKGLLIWELRCFWRRGDSWIEILGYYYSFHDSGKHWCNGYWTVGRKSVIKLGWATFGADLMYACFHWIGTVSVAMDKLNSCVSGVQKTGHPV